MFSNNVRHNLQISSPCKAGGRGRRGKEDVFWRGVVGIRMKALPWTIRAIVKKDLPPRRKPGPRSKIPTKNRFTITIYITLLYKF
jgi:hypothetical protein